MTNFNFAVLLCRVVLPLYQETIAVLNIIDLVESGHTVWATCNTLLQFSPGLLEVIFWTVEAMEKRASLKEAMVWIISFSIFPLAIIIW